MLYTIFYWLFIIFIGIPVGFFGLALALFIFKYASMAIICGIIVIPAVIADKILSSNRFTHRFVEKKNIIYEGLAVVIGVIIWVAIPVYIADKF